MEKLLIYINSLDKQSRAAFFVRCNTTEGYIRKTASKGARLGAAICVAIERESNSFVTRKDLHPSDWDAIWPELVCA